MIVKLVNPDYTFSVYENLYSVEKPLSSMDVNQLIEIVKFGYLKEPIEKIRKAKTKKEYSYFKNSSLLCVTTSGIFGHRSSKGLVRHSGLIQIDIDKIPNYDDLFGRISKDSYTYLCFRSPGGEGIKVVVKINPKVETHLQQYYALQRYFKSNFNTDIDNACKDIARAMLLSYDPNIYCNPHSDVFEELYISPTQAESTKNGMAIKNTYVSYSQDTNELVSSIVDEIERRGVDITTPYENWVRIGFALTDSLGEGGREYFHRISMMNPDYNKTKCNKKYGQLMKDNKGTISIATLIYHAKAAGIKTRAKAEKKR